MEDYTALIGDRTALRALALPLTDGAVPEVVARVLDLPDTVAAVFVIGLGPAEATAVQAETTSAGGPLVLTQLDVVSAALAAATATVLHARGVAPGRGRVVVAGADSAPRLEPVLRGSGTGSVTTFFHRDASTIPLRPLMTHHDVLIDLTGTVSPSTAPGRTISVPIDLFDMTSIALPGLLSALCGHGCSVLTADALAAAARAIALVTPAGRTLPDLNNRVLVSAVARHVSRTLDARQTPYPHRHS